MTDAADARLARAAIVAGRALEARWLAGDDPAAPCPRAIGDALTAFARAIEAAAQANDPDLARLARLAVGPDASLKQVYCALVPFERWAQRPLRDDEFLVTDGDRAEAPSRVPARPLAALCDNVRSAFNVGSIMRAAECAGCDRVWLTGYTPAPARTAMGAEALVPWRSFGRLAEAAAALKQENFSLIALETSARAVPLAEMRWPDRCALLVGNERFGLDADALRLADGVCRIPTYGRKNSLNVASAFAVAAFEHRRATESRA